MAEEKQIPIGERIEEQVVEKIKESANWVAWEMEKSLADNILIMNIPDECEKALCLKGDTPYLNLMQQVGLVENKEVLSVKEINYKLTRNGILFYMVYMVTHYKEKIKE